MTRGVARSLVFISQAKPVRTLRSGSAPFRFHGVGLGPLFRFFTVTEIVVAVIRRTVTYKKHRATQMAAWPLCISYFSGPRGLQGAGEPARIPRCSYTKKRAQCSR